MSDPVTREDVLRKIRFADVELDESTNEDMHDVEERQIRALQAVAQSNIAVAYATLMVSTRRQRAEAERERARRWRPLERAVLRPPSPEKVAAMRAAAIEREADPDEAERMMFDHGELWMNDRYTVSATRHEEGWIELLSIKRNDRQPDIPWRHLQRMKTEIIGADAEAIEIYPAESRLVDTANQRWLWCFPPGFTVPRGFNNGRTVTGPEEAAKVGAVQAPLDEEEVPHD